MKTSYSAAEIAERLGLSRQSVVKSASKGAWSFKEESIQGGKTKLFEFAKLPLEIQRKLAAAETAEIAEVADQQPDESRPQKKLDAKQRELALARYDFVRKFRAIEGREQKAEFVDDFNAGLVLKTARETIGKTLSLRTAYRWLQESTDDPFALAPKYGRPSGCHISQAEQRVIGILLHPNRPSIATAIRKMRKQCEREKIKPTASDSTIRRFIGEWKTQNEALWALRREGEKAFTDKFLPYVERDKYQLEVGEVLQADGHDLNFDIINPYTGKPQRMTLIAFFDWRSGMPVGMEIMPTETTQAIASALRMGLINLGHDPRQRAIPMHVVLDNGRAFRSKYFTGTEDFETAGIAGLYERLGLKCHFTRAYHARSKGNVERFFGIFNEDFSRFVESYRGRSVDDKPATLRRNETWLQARHERPVPTINEVKQAINEWIATDYGMRLIDGERPLEVLNAGRGAGVNVDMLDYLMLSVEEKVPSRQGIKLFGNYYYNESLFGWREKVVCRFSYDDLRTIKVYTPDDELICTAGIVSSVHPLALHRIDEAPLEYAKVKESLKLQQSLKRATKKAADAAAQIYGSDELLDRQLERITQNESPARRAEPLAIAATPHEANQQEILDSSPSQEFSKKNGTKPEEANNEPPKRPMFDSYTDKFYWLRQYARNGFATEEDLDELVEAAEMIGARVDEELFLQHRTGAANE